MSDNEWELWFEYTNDKEQFEQEYFEEWALHHPYDVYVPLTDEELLLAMKEAYAA